MNLINSYKNIEEMRIDEIIVIESKVFFNGDLNGEEICEKLDFYDNFLLGNSDKDGSKIKELSNKFNLNKINFEKYGVSGTIYSKGNYNNEKDSNNDNNKLNLKIMEYLTK